MSYNATVLEVMIASPSDVTREREVVRTVVSEWNDLHSRTQKVVMLSVGWDTHSSPDLGGRPQQLINDRILKNADIVVGIFWTRIGSPTGVASSGSVEEIQRHHQSKKPVMLYFSDMPVAPGSYDNAQYEELQKFKAWGRTQGIVSDFSDAESFREDFRRHLQITLRDNQYLNTETKPAAPSIAESMVLSTPIVPTSTQLTKESLDLLKWAADPNAQHAMIAIHRHIGGAGIRAGNQQIPSDTAREVAKWEAAALQLFNLGLTRDINGKREMFELNDRGFQVGDALIKSS